MWIAKPLKSLTQDEQEGWHQVLERQRRLARDAPLAQTLAWGRAIEAVSGQVYVVFSLEEGAGGLIFAAAPGAYECINGPLLEWDEPATAMRQLATFAQVATRLGPEFASLTLRPRWPRDLAARRLLQLPLPAAGTSQA